ncbi:lipoyltransferase 2 [Wolffia australiana]
MRTGRCVEIWRLGRVAYAEALALQQRLVEERKAGKIADTILSLQHPPTFTLGKRRTLHNLLVSEPDLRAMAAELHHTDRGGDVTFHGPGQAVLYPIVSLRAIGLGPRRYVEALQAAMVRLAGAYGVPARAGGSGEAGAWVGQRKIGAVGVRVSGGVTCHGLAFNIDPDLSYFAHIVPCGIADKEVTSLRKEAGAGLPGEELVQDRLARCVVEALGFDRAVWLDRPDCPLL